MSRKVRGEECLKYMNRCGGQGFLLCHPFTNLGGGCIVDYIHTHVQGRHMKAEGC